MTDTTSVPAPTAATGPASGATDQSAVVPVTIDVWSDVACPWCYIGKRRLEQGVESAGVPVEIRYHAFELDPGAKPADGRTELDVLGLKIGSRDQAVQALSQVTAVAAGEGLQYDFDSLVPTNTVAAHRLAAHALEVGGPQVQVAVVEELYRAHFTTGEDVGDTEVLVAVAGRVGLDPDAARAALADGATLDAVRSDEAQAAQLGIRGVPFFVIDGKYAVSGAQQSEVFAAGLQQAVAER